MKNKGKNLLSICFVISLTASDSSSAQSSLSDTEVNESQTKASKWSLSEDKDPITDEVSKYATITSNESDYLYLKIYCIKSRGFDSLLLESGEHNTYKVSEVTYRVDKAEPVTDEPWFASDTVLIRVFDGQDFIDDFYQYANGGETLVMRTKPMDPDDRSVTLTFDIRGIERARQHVLDSPEC